jgi:hypothetical protein
VVSGRAAAPGGSDVPMRGGLVDAPQLHTADIRAQRADVETCRIGSNTCAICGMGARVDVVGIGGAEALPCNRFRAMRAERNSAAVAPNVLYQASCQE